MPVVKIRVMRMPVGESAVPVRVAVRLARWIVWRMGVLVMRVMDVPVLVLHRGMNMLVLMALPEMEPKPDPHQ